jgi:hypothetical protein
MDLYSTSPLESKTEIRTLRLYQGLKDDAIICSLEKTDLAKWPSYEALSYCWGSPKHVRHIYVDGRNVEVRENLWWALWHLRREDKDRVIWVDALCINQSKVQERNHQVRLMSRIYCQAFDVIAWLGREGGGSDMAMDYLNNILRQKEMTPEERSAIEKILSRDYWSRTWIVQEIGLAFTVTVWCGNKSVDGRLLECLRSYDWEARSAFTVIHFRRSRSETRRESRIAHTVEWEVWGGPREGETLLWLVDHFLDRQCADPRDTVNALLGLASDYHAKSLVGDYHKSLLRTYVELARFYLCKRGFIPKDIEQDPVGFLVFVLGIFLELCSIHSSGRERPNLFTTRSDISRIRYRGHSILYDDAIESLLLDIKTPEGIEMAIGWLRTPLQDSDTISKKPYIRWPANFPEEVRQFSKLHLFLSNFRETTGTLMEIFKERILFYIQRMKIEITLDINSGLFCIYEGVTLIEWLECR